MNILLNLIELEKLIMISEMLSVVANFCYLSNSGNLYCYSALEFKVQCYTELKAGGLGWILENWDKKKLNYILSSQIKKSVLPITVSFRKTELKIADGNFKEK